MADTKISDLAAVTDVQDTDEFVLARAGTSNKIDGVDLRSELAGGGLYSAEAYLRDEKAANTSGGATSTGSFIRRVLNTEVYDPSSIVTLDTVTNIGRFTLAAGTYKLFGQAPFFKSERTRLKFRDITNSVDLGLGANIYVTSGTLEAGYANVWALFTLSGSTDIELQYRCATSDGIGLGVESNFGIAEVYAEVWIWREG